jgi:hypothetical protein
VIHESIT